ncbi:luc7-like protein 3 isoform X2 [Uloborus diversus]|uniref:luc7-like protein 3 isoform X2 n=1 Tax=Uloborus diversus TaxID=327109 RepID=UPI002409E030|nr:luc7-like protein 3 isoform X2 [Uloborus diversus]
MALLSAKQLLDELMGRDRDLGLEEKKNDFTWDGPDVCKHFLVKFCPNDLFVNTKADLGVCPKIHDERLKREYEKSSRFQQMGYEEDFLRFCQSMLSDVDKRIRRARQRLALSSKEASISQPTQVKNNEEKVNVLTEKINGLLVQVENLGCEGKVEEAQGIMKLCEQLKEERETLRKASEANHWFQTAEIAAAQEKQMEVCEVCGAFLIVGDAQQRVDDHLMGKQHVGYAKLKEAVDEILSHREKERSDREKLRDKEREERRKAKEEDDRKREERRKRFEDERRRDLEKRDRTRRRSRSRERTGNRGHSHRSRSKERHSHSKSKDKDRSRKRSKSSDRKRERSKSSDRKRERSKSSDRKRERSKSSDRKRERSKSHDRHSRHSRSRSREHRRDRKDRKDEEKSRKHRRQSYENGDSSEKLPRSEDNNKGRHSSGD